jgi:hypothetical protein
VTVGADHYVPLLRAKQGELQALEHSPPSVRARMTPLVDVMAEDLDDAESDLDRVVARLRDGWGTTDGIVVDANSLGDSTTSSGVHVVAYLHGELDAIGVQSVPTVYLSSSATFVTEVALAAHSARRGACIRVSTDDLANTLSLTADINGVLAALNLQPDEIDLIIDMSVVDASTIGLHAALLGMVLPTLPHLANWRSFTLAGGAFPINLDAFSPYVPGAAPRFDAQLWRRVSSHALPRAPSYGDYGVSHPLSVAAGPWRGAPNLRYTLADDWYVLKGRANSSRGNFDFHDLCAQAAATTPNVLRPATFSWGDAEVQRCAAGQGGPGGGTQWRAWSTSHHLSVVTERLANLGVP